MRKFYNHHEQTTLTKKWMNAPVCFQLYCDGACRGNPGPASIGAVLWENEAQASRAETAQACFQISERIGSATNNIAEYSAVIRGLQESLAQKDVQHLAIYLDSELVVKQLSGEYKVKSPQMRPLYAQARDLLAKFHSYKLYHIPREKNSVADYLANAALD